MTPDSYRIRLGGGLRSPGALLVPHFIVLFSFLPRNNEQAFYWYVFVRLRGGCERRYYVGLWSRALSALTRLVTAR